VICGEPEYHDALKVVVLNPKVILEVLSEGTEAFDRGEKFTRFQTWKPSLTDYVLVSQDRTQVEHFVRQPDGSWSCRRTAGLDANLVMTSIKLTAP
jgi:Uma2 family endonuclease